MVFGFGYGRYLIRKLWPDWAAKVFGELGIAYNILKQKVLDDDEIAKAELWLSGQQKLFIDNKIKHHLTISKHMESHVGDKVKQLGPFHCTSMWTFERKFGEVVKNLRNMRHAEKQLMEAMALKDHVKVMWQIQFIARYLLFSTTEIEAHTS